MATVCKELFPNTKQCQVTAGLTHIWRYVCNQRKTRFHFPFQLKSKAPRSELMDELNYCRKDSLIIKEKHINLFERFIVYGLAKIQRDLKYPIACAPENTVCDFDRWFDKR